MITSLADRSCIVTGAAQGIGQAIAEALAAAGARVAVLDVDVERGKRVTARLGDLASFYQADVTHAGQLKRVVESVVARHGGVDVLVNNAGVASYNDAAKMTEDEWDAVFAVDLKGVWLCCRAVLPFMRAAGSGSIVNVSSIHARMTTAGMFPYAAAKAGVIGLTHSLALDEGPHGIRVNAVCPGYTRTQLVQEYFDRQPDPGAAERSVVGVHALGRIVEPSEVAAVVGFLASDLASGMTGAEVVVDAGLSARFA